MGKPRGPPLACRLFAQAVAKRSRKFPRSRKPHNVTTTATSRLMGYSPQHKDLLLRFCIILKSIAQMITGVGLLGRGVLIRVAIATVQAGRHADSDSVSDSAVLVMADGQDIAAAPAGTQAAWNHCGASALPVASMTLERAESTHRWGCVCHLPPLLAPVNQNAQGC